MVLIISRNVPITQSSVSTLESRPSSKIGEGVPRPTETVFVYMHCLIT